MTEIDGLIKKLGMNCSNQEGEFISISCSNEFEPHGRASETWEIIWRLYLPNTPYHWRSTKGWVKGHPDPHLKPGMGFSGRTLEDCVKQANQFLDEWKP